MLVVAPLTLLRGGGLGGRAARVWSGRIGGVAVDARHTANLRAGTCTTGKRKRKNRKKRITHSTNTQKMSSAARKSDTERAPLAFWNIAHSPMTVPACRLTARSATRLHRGRHGRRAEVVVCGGELRGVVRNVVAVGFAGLRAAA